MGFCVAAPNIPSHVMVLWCTRFSNKRRRRSAWSIWHNFCKRRPEALTMELNGFSNIQCPFWCMIAMHSNTTCRLTPSERARLCSPARESIRFPARTEGNCLMVNVLLTLFDPMRPGTSVGVQTNGSNRNHADQTGLVSPCGAQPCTHAASKMLVSFWAVLASPTRSTLAVKATRGFLGNISIMHFFGGPKNRIYVFWGPQSVVLGLESWLWGGQIQTRFG